MSKWSSLFELNAYCAALINSLSIKTTGYVSHNYKLSVKFQIGQKFNRWTRLLKSLRITRKKKPNYKPNQFLAQRRPCRIIHVLAVGWGDNSSKNVPLVLFLSLLLLLYLLFKHCSLNLLIHNCFQSFSQLGLRLLYPQPFCWRQRP